ncbi:hypothetical protein MPER_11613, partial [Moniliophthora perniciosa FA553]
MKAFGRRFNIFRLKCSQLRELNFNAALASDSPQERRSPSPNDLKKGHDSLVMVDSQLEAANYATSGFPEGGPDATRTIIGAFMALFVQLGVMNSFGVFEAQYVRVDLQSKSPSDISWIGTCQFFVFFFSGAFVGRFFDSFGARPLLFPGAVILVLSLVATSYCYEYYQFFLAQGLLFGIGSSLVFYPALSSITHWYEQKRGRMMGLVTAGSSLGGVMFPIALNHLIPALGFPLALRIIAPFNRELSSLVDVGGFRDIKYTLFLAASAITMLGSFNPYYFATLYSETHNYSSNITFYSLAILNAGSFFGRLIPGILADRLGFFNVLSIALTIAGTILLCWIAVSSAASFVVWLVFYGFFSGAFI